MKEQTVLCRRMDVMTADMNGSTVMMDIETGKYYDLGQVGGRIWELLEQPITLAALADKLTGEYAVDRAKCLADMTPFLEDLVCRGLVQAEL